MQPRWTPDREDLAWAAGFFDGEGCFSFTDRAAHASVSICGGLPHTIPLRPVAGRLTGATHELIATF
jgi:hypothetical protein